MRVRHLALWTIAAGAVLIAAPVLAEGSDPRLAGPDVKRIGAPTRQPVPPGCGAPDSLTVTLRADGAAPPGTRHVAIEDIAPALPDLLALGSLFAAAVTDIRLVGTMSDFPGIEVLVPRGDCPDARVLFR